MVLIDIGININSNKLFYICFLYNLSYKTKEALVLINQLIDIGLDINTKLNIKLYAIGYIALIAIIIYPFLAITYMLIYTKANIYAINNYSKIILYLVIENCL